jgi:hypothetical protein
MAPDIDALATSGNSLKTVSVVRVTVVSVPAVMEVGLHE